MRTTVVRSRAGHVNPYRVSPLAGGARNREMRSKVNRGAQSPTVAYSTARAPPLGAPFLGTIATTWTPDERQTWSTAQCRVCLYWQGTAALMKHVRIGRP